MSAPWSNGGRRPGCSRFGGRRSGKGISNRRLKSRARDLPNSSGSAALPPRRGRLSLRGPAGLPRRRGSSKTATASARRRRPRVCGDLRKTPAAPWPRSPKRFSPSSPLREVSMDSFRARYRPAAHPAYTVGDEEEVSPRPHQQRVVWDFIPEVIFVLRTDEAGVCGGGG